MTRTRTPSRTRRAHATSARPPQTRSLRTSTSVAAATAWRQGRLIVRDLSLSEVVEELNRYREQPIRIADAKIGQPANEAADPDDAAPGSDGVAEDRDDQGAGPERRPAAELLDERSITEV